MADTKRVMSALQTLLADNSSGDISAQDVRDFLVSVYGSWTTTSKVFGDSPYTNSLDDVTICFNATSGNIVHNLYGDEGKVLLIVKTDSSANTVTLTPTGGDTINGGVTQTIADQNMAVLIAKCGTDWKIIAPSLFLTKGSGVGSLFIGSGVSSVGSFNVVVGQETGASLTSNNNINVLVGHQAARDLAGNGEHNVFIGAGAGKQRTFSEKDTAVGANALSDPSIASGETANTAIGFRALDNVTTGIRNVGLGYRAGSNTTIDIYYPGITIGSGNISIGTSSGAITTSDSNSIAIGLQARAGSSAIAIGYRNVNNIANTATIGSSYLPLNQLGMVSDGGSMMSMRSLSENITITAATNDSIANLLPASAYIVGVVARVTTVISGSRTWKLGDVSTDDKFAVVLQPGIAGHTTNSFSSGIVAPGGPTTPLAPFLNVTAGKIRITPSATGASGVIRVTVFYFDMTPPTS